MRLLAFFGLCAVRPLRGFVRFGLSAVIRLLPLKPVAKAWAFGLLFGHYLHREGIVMGHILVVGVPSVCVLRS